MGVAVRARKAATWPGWRRWCCSSDGAVLRQVDQHVAAVVGGAHPQPVQLSARTTSTIAIAASTAIRSASGASGDVACRW